MQYEHPNEKFFGIGYRMPVKINVRFQNASQLRPAQNLFPNVPMLVRDGNQVGDPPDPDVNEKGDTGKKQAADDSGSLKKDKPVLGQQFPHLH